MEHAKHRGRINAFGRWAIPDKLHYLNQAAFAPLRADVNASRALWLEEYCANPTKAIASVIQDTLPELLLALTSFLGATRGRCYLTQSAIHGMATISQTLTSKTPSVVLSTFEFPSVVTFWDKFAMTAGGSTHLLSISPYATPQELYDSVIDKLLECEATLFVVSHVSYLGEILPIHILCRAANSIGVPVCIDGSQSFGLMPLDLDALQCTYYCASGYKWLGASIGCGLLWVDSTNAPSQCHFDAQDESPMALMESLLSSGTVDLSPFITMKAALEFLESIGSPTLFAASNRMASIANVALSDVLGTDPHQDGTFASTVYFPLGPEYPHSDDGLRNLNDRLTWEFDVVATIVTRATVPIIRVSCGLHNDDDDISALAEALIAMKHADW